MSVVNEKFWEKARLKKKKKFRKKLMIQRLRKEDNTECFKPRQELRH